MAKSGEVTREIQRQALELLADGLERDVKSIREGLSMLPKPDLSTVHRAVNKLTTSGELITRKFKREVPRGPDIKGTRMADIRAFRLAQESDRKKEPIESNGGHWAPEDFEPVEIPNCRGIRISDSGKGLLVEGLFPGGKTREWLPVSQIQKNSEVYGEDTAGILVVPHKIAQSKGLI